MIKVTLVVEVANKKTQDEIREIGEKYASQLEAAEEYGMEPPKKPVYYLEEGMVEQVRITEYIDPNDIRRMTRLDGTTILYFYSDDILMTVKESPAKILKLKNEYNEKYPSNISRVLNIYTAGSISYPGEF